MHQGRVQLGSLLSVDDIIALHPSLGIPHFQRGLVWDPSNVALLLESLYLGTPCGSILLWEPAPEVGALAATPQKPYLIVDGQQRIESLFDVFAAPDDASSDLRGGAGDGGEEEVGDSAADRVWCLNLGQIPELQAQFHGGKRYGLFRLVIDPREYSGGDSRRRAPARDIEALLPLRWFLDHDDDQLRTLVRSGRDAALAPAAGAVLNNQAVRDRVRAMRTQRLFHPSWLGQSVTLADAVGIFNRINSAGKRVEAEETAFAALVAASRGGNVERAIRDFFASVHGSGDGGRNTWLARERESKFGFKLFMRVFTIALTYHSHRSLGSSSFSFGSITDRALKEATPCLDELLADTRRALEDVSTIVQETLYCDDLRMLPDASSLWPVFQLLVRFPQVGKARGTVASIILRLMTADLSNPELLALCGGINAALDVDAALATFDACPALSGLFDANATVDRLADAKSMTNRQTLMLYWLERGLKTKDFSYSKNKVKDLVALRAIHPVEAVIAKGIQPQKQHIVPYKRLKEIYGLEGPRRGNHDVNDIGNITYISKALNSIRIGLGSTPLNLEVEEAANLDAHLLSHGSEGLLVYYRRACEASDLGEARESYEKFCELRRERIAQAIRYRSDELAAARMSEQVAERGPRRRLLGQDQFGPARKLPQALAAAIQHLRETDSAVSAQSKAEFEAFKLVDGKGRSRIKISVATDASVIKVKLRERRLRDLFEEAFPAIPLAQNGKSKHSCTLAVTDGSAVRVIEWCAAEVAIEEGEPVPELVAV